MIMTVIFKDKAKHSDDYNLTINDINLVINKIMIRKHQVAAKKKNIIHIQDLYDNMFGH